MGQKAHHVRWRWIVVQRVTQRGDGMPNRDPIAQGTPAGLEWVTHTSMSDAQCSHGARRRTPARFNACRAVSASQP
jgi:hypothetical protein